MILLFHRGEESATLLTPFLKKLTISALGTSVGTPEQGITAPAIVANCFDELKELGRSVCFLEA